jgi:hypothetical protein
MPWNLFRWWKGWGFIEIRFIIEKQQRYGGIKMGLTKIIALIFLTLILTTSVAVTLTTGYEGRHVTWKGYIAGHYGTNDCVDKNTYYKMLEATSRGFCYFSDEEFDWARNNIGYCTPRCWIRVSTEIQFVNENLNFTVRAKGGGNHTIVSYKWDFGDGTIENGTELSQSTSYTGGLEYKCTSTHSYSSEGNYTVKLTVTNNQGHTDVDKYPLLVEIISDVKSKSVTMEDLQYKYGETWGSDKYKKGDFEIFRKTQKGLGEPQVGEITIIKGKEYVHLRKYTEDGTLEKVWDIPVSDDPIFVHIYKNDLKIFGDIVYTDTNGEFTCYFSPEEAGYHKLVVEYPGPYMDYCMSYESPNWDYKEGDYWYEQDFYVSEKLEQEQSKSPGFEAIFIITALLAVAYLLRRRE